MFAFFGATCELTGCLKDCSLIFAKYIINNWQYTDPEPDVRTFRVRLLTLRQCIDFIVIV